MCLQSTNGFIPKMARSKSMPIRRLARRMQPHTMASMMTAAEAAEHAADLTIAAAMVPVVVPAVEIEIIEVSDDEGDDESVVSVDLDGTPTTMEDSEEDGDESYEPSEEDDEEPYEDSEERVSTPALQQAAADFLAITDAAIEAAEAEAIEEYEDAQAAEADDDIEEYEESAADEEAAVWDAEAEAGLAILSEVAAAGMLPLGSQDAFDDMFDAMMGELDGVYTSETVTSG